MSVHVSERTVSKTEVLHKAYKLRDSVMLRLFYDFGYKPTPRKHETVEESERRYEVERWFIGEKRKDILHVLSLIVNNITLAVKSTPKTDREWERRREYWTRAIGGCYVLLQELQFVINTVNPDLNYYTPIALEIEEEYEMIKEWRRKDNELRQGTEGKV